MKNLFKSALIVFAVTTLVLSGCKTADKKVKYAGTLTDLKWSTGNYITWGGDQSMFPKRPGNVSGFICLVEANGNDVNCEMFRPGYRRQKLDNAYGKGEHSLTITKPGDTIEVYLCALTPDGFHPDRSVRTNPMKLVWRKEGGK